MDIANTLIANDSVLSQYAFWKDIFRTLAWSFAKVLKLVCDSAESLYDSAYSLLNFTQYDGIQNFINSFKPVMVAILIAAILGIGITLMFCTDKIRKYIYNFLIFIGIVSALPYIITSMNKVVLSGKDAVYSGVDNMSQELFAGQVDDLVYMSQGGLGSDGKFAMTGNQIDKTKIEYIDINEVINPDNSQLSSEYQQLFKSQKQINADGSITVDEISEKFLSIFDPPFYYRFHVDWLLLFLSLISLIIAYIFTAYRVVRLVWELIAGQLIAFLASPDITNGQRVLKILETMKNTYIGIFLTCVFIKIYTIAITYVRGQKFGSFTEVFLIVFFTLALLDGPNMIERIFGVDIGIKPLLAMQASAGIAKTGVAAAKGVKNMGQKLFQSAVNHADKFSDRAEKYTQSFGNVSNNNADSSKDIGESNSGKNENTQTSSSSGTAEAGKFNATGEDASTYHDSGATGNSMNGAESDMDRYADQVGSEESIDADNIASSVSESSGFSENDYPNFGSSLDLDAESVPENNEHALDHPSFMQGGNMENMDYTGEESMDNGNSEYATNSIDQSNVPEMPMDIAQDGLDNSQKMNVSESGNGEAQVSDLHSNNQAGFIPDALQTERSQKDVADMRDTMPDSNGSISSYPKQNNTLADSINSKNEGNNHLVNDRFDSKQNIALNSFEGSKNVTPKDTTGTNNDLKKMLSEIRKGQKQNMKLPDEEAKTKDE